MQLVVCRQCHLTLRYEVFKRHCCGHVCNARCALKNCPNLLEQCPGEIYGCDFSGSHVELQLHELSSCTFLQYERAWLRLQKLHNQIFARTLFVFSDHQPRIVVYDPRRNQRTVGILMCVNEREAIVCMHEVNTPVDLLLVIPLYAASQFELDIESHSPKTFLCC